MSFSSKPFVTLLEIILRLVSLGSCIITFAFSQCMIAGLDQLSLIPLEVWKVVCKNEII